MEEELIINKVINSGLVTFDLEDLYDKGERVVYDLKDNLFMGMILKEKDLYLVPQEVQQCLYQKRFLNYTV